MLGAAGAANAGAAFNHLVILEVTDPRKGARSKRGVAAMRRGAGCWWEADVDLMAPPHPIRGGARIKLITVESHCLRFLLIILGRNGSGNYYCWLKTDRLKRQFRPKEAQTGLKLDTTKKMRMPHQTP
jgi:hypothetical protein